MNWILVFFNQMAHDALVLLGCGLLIAVALVAGCLAYDKFIFHTSVETKHRVIDIGYWAFIIPIGIYLLITFPVPAYSAVAIPNIPTQVPTAAPSQPIPTNAIPLKYSEPCFPGQAVMRHNPLTDQQKRDQAASCGK